MGLLDKARKDVQRILTDLSGFAVEVTISNGNGDSATVAGLYSNHHISVNEENVPVNSKKASITVTEKALTDEGYPVRDNNGEIKLNGHNVVYKDSTGNDQSYAVSESFPDETVGNIVLILQDRV